MKEMETSAILALGEALSTETGRLLAAIACENFHTLSFYRKKLLPRYEGKRSSKESQEAKYYEGMSLGASDAYTAALASLACEMSNGKAMYKACSRLVREELKAMDRRTYEQTIAAPLSNIHSRAIDW